MALQDVYSSPQTEEELDPDIKAIFMEAQRNRHARGEGRCAVCGGVFQRGECIECGHSVK